MTLRAGTYLPLLALLIVFVLTVDSVAPRWVQWPLAVLVAGTLAYFARQLPPLQRATIVVVMVLAFGGELLASEVWHRYEYRFGSLPPYVPFGHALVYLAGLATWQADWARRNSAAIRSGAVAALAAWVVLGLTTLDRVDVSGSISAIVLAGFLLLGHRGVMYAGIFAAVALLEVYGTVVGVWTWADVVPGTGLTGGNPPSGAAATYVLCDVVAIAIAPWALHAWQRVSGSRAGSAGNRIRGGAEVDPHARIEPHHGCRDPELAGQGGQPHHGGSGSLPD